MQITLKLKLNLKLKLILRLGLNLNSTLTLTLRIKDRRYAGYQQQDASEFLAKLLEGLSEDLNRVQGDKPYVQDPDDDGRSDFTLAKEHWERHLAREDHPVSAV